MERDDTSDPRDDARTSQSSDPASGASDDPRVDPTPDRRQTSDSPPPSSKRNAFGVLDPTSDEATS